MSGSAHNHAVGEAGENAAAQWYVEHGYVIVDRNWRVREGEIDIVCMTGRPDSARGGTLVFCEVKTRTSSRFGSGADAVGWKKQRQVRRVAMVWLDQSDTYFDEIRFDVADVDGSGHVIIHEDCF